MIKPTTPQLTPQEIKNIQQTLDKTDTNKRLERTQKAIVNLLETEGKIYRNWSIFREREGIKGIGSVVEKINDHR